MATSDRILSTVNRTEFQRISAQDSWNVPRRSYWPQLVGDFATISLALVFAPSVFTKGMGVPAVYLPISPISVAAMVTTILFFTGTYSPRPTPLGIGNTVGLIRGLCCCGSLATICAVSYGALPGPVIVVSGCSVVLSLAIQREMKFQLDFRRPLPWFLGGYRKTIRNLPIDVEPQLESRSDYLLKRMFDVTIAMFLLLLTWPLFLAIAALIKIDSEGPVFLRQRRIGRYGIPFSIWKFRSMHQQAPRYARSPLTDNDPRLTKVGRALRRCSIDELPQLFNVIKGDMSLVGPRPEMPFVVDQYGPFERLRLNATPGITGLWQISPARAMPIHHNLQLDLFYIDHRSFLLDIAILLRTMPAVIRGIGAA